MLALDAGEAYLGKMDDETGWSRFHACFRRETSAGEAIAARDASVVHPQGVVNSRKESGHVWI